MTHPLADNMYDHDQKQGQLKGRQEQDERNQTLPSDSGKDMSELEEIFKRTHIDHPKELMADIEAYISKHYIKKEDVLKVFDDYEYDDEDYIITPHIINLQEKLNLGDK